MAEGPHFLRVVPVTNFSTLSQGRDSPTSAEQVLQLHIEGIKIMSLDRRMLGSQKVSQ